MLAHAQVNGVDLQDAGCDIEGLFFLFFFSSGQLGVCFLFIKSSPKLLSAWGRETQERTNAIRMIQSSHQNRAPVDVFRGRARDQKRSAMNIVGMMIMAMSNARREAPLACEAPELLDIVLESADCERMGAG